MSALWTLNPAIAVQIRAKPIGKEAARRLLAFLGGRVWATHLPRVAVRPRLLRAQRAARRRGARPRDRAVHRSVFLATSPARATGWGHVLHHVRGPRSPPISLVAQGTLWIL